MRCSNLLAYFARVVQAVPTLRPYSLEVEVSAVRQGHQQRHESSPDAHVEGYGSERKYRLLLPSHDSRSLSRWIGKARQSCLKVLYWRYYDGYSYFFLILSCRSAWKIRLVVCSSHPWSVSPMPVWTPLEPTFLRTARACTYGSDVRFHQSSWWTSLVWLLWMRLTQEWYVFYVWVFSLSLSLSLSLHDQALPHTLKAQKWLTTNDPHFWIFAK